MNLLFWFLFIIAYFERVVFDLGPNIELVTVASLMAASYLGTRKALYLVLLILISTDIIIGNTNIFLFTWSGFVIPALIAGVLFSKTHFNGLNRALLGSGLGIGANLFFFIWTNFGVWALDGWGMYADDFSGLVMCYVNALPFLRAQLISTLLFVPAGFVIVEYLSDFWFISDRIIVKEKR